MILTVATFALLNLIGGRVENVFNSKTLIRGSLLFRAIIPAILMGIHTQSIYIATSIGIGSALWCVFGWSFDEINGQYDPNKYHAWVKRIGLNLVPLDAMDSSNRKRGIIMKGLRGGYDLLTFALLSIVNPYALIFWPITLLMGLIYWICGRIFPSNMAVALAELSWGAVRGVLIAITI